MRFRPANDVSTSSSESESLASLWLSDVESDVTGGFDRCPDPAVPVIGTAEDDPELAEAFLADRRFLPFGRGLNSR